MPYSEREKQLILETFIKTNNSAKLAQRELRRINPRMHVPDKKTFLRIYEKFQQTSSRARKKRTMERDENSDLNILLKVEENPNISLRTISKSLKEELDDLKNTSYGRIQNTLKKVGYKAFKIRPTTKLTPGQREKRVEFCQTMLEKINLNNSYLKTIFWTDESSFSTSGMINRKNTRLWATVNPHCYREFKFQGRQTVNVWCAILNNKIIGPHFFNVTLNGNVYLNFLQQELEDYFDELPLEQERNIVFQQDGAPPHSVVAVKNYLNQRFNGWIGRDAPIKWPPNSPDLTPMDAFLWGTLKDRVNANIIENTEHLKELIRTEIQILNEDYTQSITAALERLRRTYIKCIEENGGPVEQFNL